VGIGWGYLTGTNGRIRICGVIQFGLLGGFLDSDSLYCFEFEIKISCFRFNKPSAGIAGPLLYCFTTTDNEA
jgi:hypothetical protein